jgi:TolB-like protein
MTVLTFVLMLRCSLAAADGTPPAEAAKRPRLFVAELAAQGVAPGQAAAFTDAVVAALSQRGLFEVVGNRELQTLLGMQRQRELLGICETNPEQCARDVANSLAARLVLSGQLSRIGSAFQLTLQTVDTQKGQPVARSTRLSGSAEELTALVPYAAAEATGSPLPPPRSRVLSVTLLGAGGATVLSGGAVALLAYSRQSALNDELCPGGVPLDGRCGGTNLRSRDFYVQQERALQTQLWLGAGIALAGAALMGAGLWLMPPADAGGRMSLAVVPQSSGLLLAGDF